MVEQQAAIRICIELSAISGQLRQQLMGLLVF